MERELKTQDDARPGRASIEFFFIKQKTAYEMEGRDWSSAGALPISPPTGTEAAWQPKKKT